MEENELTVSLLQSWHVAAQSVQRAVTEALRRQGLSETAGGVIWALDPTATAPTARELAYSLGCDPSNVSLLTAKLESEGLIRRRAHPTDGRARQIVLTAKGKDQRARLISELAINSPLTSLQPQQRRALRDLLSQLA